jgi:hypothetical protein
MLLTMTIELLLLLLLLLMTRTTMLQQVQVQVQVQAQAQAQVHLQALLQVRSLYLLELWSRGRPPAHDKRQNVRLLPYGLQESISVRDNERLFSPKLFL